MTFIEFIISLGSAIIIILIGIISYFVKKDFNRTEKELVKKRDAEICDAIHNNLIDNVAVKVSAIVSKSEKTIEDKYIDALLKTQPCHSPISLSEKDIEILKDAEFDKYVKDNKIIFTKHFQKNRPRNRAKGLKETVILIMALDEKRTIDLDELKNVGYQEGKTETDMQIIAGVYVWLNIIEPFLYGESN